MKTRNAQSLIRGSRATAWLLLTNSMLTAQGTTPSTLAPASTPAHQIFDLSIFVVAITRGIFLAVGGLLAVTLYRFRTRKNDPLGEPAQIYGSKQIELAWTVIPVLIVDTPAQFDTWIQNQEQPAPQNSAAEAGRMVFEKQVCMNCHTVSGTAAGRSGPDLTHLMSRATLASGAMDNNPANLRQRIKSPDTFKRGALMPAMQLTDEQLDQVTAYLETLK